LIPKSFFDDIIFMVKRGDAISLQYTILNRGRWGSDLAPDIYSIFTADVTQTNNELLATSADDTSTLTDKDINLAAHNLQYHGDIIAFGLTN